MTIHHPAAYPASNQILSVAQMRAAEEALIAAGVSVDELMQRAGRGAGEYVRRIAAGRPVTVLCGPGNNGGDGYVIAQHLLEHGNPVQVIAAREPATQAAKTARSLFTGEVSAAVPDTVPSTSGDVLVDCLFGSGLTRALPDDLFALLTGLAASHHHLVAIDVLSGVESDTGSPLNEGLPQADLTVALGAWKFAHWTMPAATLMGARRLIGIGCEDLPEAACLLEKPHLVAPAATAHKYTRGLLAVVGGEMPGASVLAAQAAMRSGAGYVKLFAEERSCGVPSELVCNTGPLNQSLEDARLSALLVGPGLGRSDAARQRLEAVLAHDVPTVVDADGLMLLHPGGRKSPLILTPHEGELAALEANFGLPGEGLRRDRVLALAQAAKAVVVLKGADSLIVAPDGALVLAPAASSWLSTAGTGDVLAGMIASRLAVHGEALRAASEGLWLHGEAARLCGPAFTAGELALAASQALGAALL